MYKQISDLDAKRIGSYYERAEAYMDMGKDMWAEMFYKRVLEHDPKNALAELGLAKVAKFRKELDSYLKHLEKAKSLDPQNQLILAEVMQNKK